MRWFDAIRRGISLLLSLVTVALLLCSLPGCAAVQRNGKPTVVCTTFVLYDWTMAVLGEDADEWNVVLLGARGADIHSYQPTAADIYTISGCSMLLHIGGESDEWVDSVLRSAQNDRMVRLDLMHSLSELMCRDEHGHEHEHEHEHEHDGEEHGADEHIWFSFELVRASCDEIARALSSIKPDAAELYEKNTAAYKAELHSLESDYVEMIAGSARREIVVCDRFPFSYLTERLGIGYEAAFEGCSAESEASFSVILRLAQALDRTQAGCVIVCESSDGAIAESVIRSSHSPSARILTLDSMQSVTQADIDRGESYLSIARRNLEVLRSALG